MEKLIETIKLRPLLGTISSVSPQVPIIFVCCLIPLRELGKFHCKNIWQRRSQSRHCGPALCRAAGRPTRMSTTCGDTSDTATSDSITSSVRCVGECCRPSRTTRNISIGTLAKSHFGVWSAGKGSGIVASGRCTGGCIRWLGLPSPV